VIPGLEDPAEQEIEDGSEEVNDPTKNVTNKIDNHGTLLWDYSLPWLMLVWTMQVHGPLTILLRSWRYVTYSGGAMQGGAPAGHGFRIWFVGKCDFPPNTMFIRFHPV
jgi:hypothetical protein